MTFLTREELCAADPAEARAYCDRLRAFLVETVSQTGGHLASNLGVVEISVALIRGMDLGRDRILYDTGHQSYVHKLLTGRGEAFSTLRSYGGLSGFPNRKESPFDPFGTGHSGTAVSAAVGFAAADRLAGRDSFTVAVIGDGSFGGGMVFEALNNVSPKDRLILILNDNGMSISQSVGTLKRTFNRMRTRRYYRFKGKIKRLLARIPLLGNGLSHLAKAMKDGVKRNTLPSGNLFEQLGLTYFGPADGNDLATVEFLLQEARRKDRPSLIHLYTKKGKGYPPAEEDPSRFHGLSPKNAPASPGKSFSRAMGDRLCALAREDDRIVAITAAMCDGVGLGEFSRCFPHRFFDTGIAEEHAMTFAAALAAAGKKPCFAVYSTFFQRAVDQLLHDAALQELPVVVCLDRAGISGEDGATHHGLFDLSLTLPLPGVRIYAPLSEEDMETALRRAFAEESHPSVIRYPKGSESRAAGFFSGTSDLRRATFGEGYPVLRIVSFGRTAEEAVTAAERLAESGVTTEVVCFFVLKGFDPEELKSTFRDPIPTLFVEEGMKIGGFSAYLLSRLEEEGLSLSFPRHVLAVEERFVPHGNTRILLQLCGLDDETIEKEGRRLVSP